MIDIELIQIKAASMKVHVEPTQALTEPQNFSVLDLIQQVARPEEGLTGRDVIQQKINAAAGSTFGNFTKRFGDLYLSRKRKPIANPVDINEGVKG